MMTNKKTGLFQLLRSFERNEVAATSIEYALIGVIMAIMLVAAIPPIVGQLAGIFTYLTAAFQTIIG